MKSTYKNPLVTGDIIIEIGREIVLIQRANPPLGWALPGGFVDFSDYFRYKSGIAKNDIFRYR